MREINKRIISIIMLICIFFSIIPLTVEAEGKNEVNRYTVLVLDTSDSVKFTSGGKIIYTANTAIDYVKKASKKFLNDVTKADGNNYISIISFNSVATVVSDFSQDINVLNSKVDNLTSYGETRSIHAGLVAANSLLANISDENAVKNVVLFTTGMTNVGEHNYTGKYDKNTVGSTWYNQGTSIHLYAYANKAYEAAQTIKENNAKLYSIGLFQVMEGMPEKGKSVVGLFKLTASDLASGTDYFYDVNNPDDLDFVFGEVADNVVSTTKKTGLFYYASGKERDYTAKYFYDDDYFSKSAYQYQDSLATMSMCLAFSAFGSNRAPNTTEGYKEKSQNLKYLLNECGFPEKDFETNDGFKGKPGTDTIGVGASHKKISVGGETYTLIGTAIRGGGYEAEWASNFTLGSSGTHKGFTQARDEVLSFLENYIQKKNITGKVKLWITGFSRAAATTNLVAGKLDSGYSLSDAIELKNDDIYAYCFEAPKGGLLKDGIKDEKYNNIHSIINPVDFVTKVAPTQPKEFGFDRYGNTKFLPSVSNKSEEKYNNLKQKMLTLYNEFESVGNYCVDDFKMKKISFSNMIKEGIVVNDNDEKWNQNLFLDEAFMKLFSENIKNRPNYVRVYEDDIREICKVVLGTPTDQWKKYPEEFMKKLVDHSREIVWYLLVHERMELTKVIESAAVEALNSLNITDYNLEQINMVAMKTVNLLCSFGLRHPNLTITLINNGKSIKEAHFPELCLAWLQSYDDNYTPEGEAEFSKGIYRIVRINCPVNVEVYNGNNHLVASIVDDKSQKVDGSSIVSYVNENDEKLVYLPAEAEYTVKITATDNGHMTYAINEFSESLGGINRVVNYLNVTFNKGDVFTGIVPSINEDEIDLGKSYGSTVEYQLLDSEKNKIPFDNDLSGEKALEADFIVNVTSNNTEYGVVYGSDCVKIGNYAKVVAVPAQGCNFKGWYEGETLVSTEKEYRFCVEKNMDLVGVFEKGSTHKHNYVANFKWSDDYKNCKVTFECQDKDDSHTMDCIVTGEIIPATATKAGKAVYTATAEFNGKTYSDIKTVVIPAEGSSADVNSDNSNNHGEAEQPNEHSAVQTGDPANIAIWMLLLILSILGIAKVVTGTIKFL